MARTAFNFGPRDQHDEYPRRTRERNVINGAERAKALNAVGMRVCVTLDDGHLKPTTITALPWQLGHGQWVVGLKDFSGGYDVMRVTPMS